MKVLWFCKGPIPKASEAFGLQISAFEGWLVQTAEIISGVSDIELNIAFIHSDLKGLQYKKVGGISFWGIEMAGDTKAIMQVLSEVEPDIVHLWGTENILALRASQCCEKQGLLGKTVVSVQGLVSICAMHYLAGLPWYVQLIPSFRDIVRRDSLLKQQKEFYKRGLLEKETLNRVHHVIGRTTWDYACTKQINPKVNYHFCNEILRSSFYKSRWELEKCERYSIFVSQAQMPLKGFHIMLEAMSVVLKRYPEAKLYVGGANNSFKSGVLKTAYGSYLQKLIKKYRLEGRVMYLGMLQEEEMKNQYLASHVFVSCSVIENSPNSLCEAMLLGMPVVASMAGGVTDLLEHGKEGFIYQSDAPYMLAHYICNFFEDDVLACKLGMSAHTRAQETNNIEKNVERLLNIYHEIQS